MDAPDASEALRLAGELRPQPFGPVSSGDIADPVVEPAWPGQRVIVGVDGDEVRLVDDTGEPIDGHDAMRLRLARQVATTAEAAVLDGYLTKQVVNDDRGIYTGPDELPSTGKLIAQSMIGVRRNRAEEAANVREAELAARTFESDDPVNLVLTDVLWLVGDSLLDVPLLERKRILESMLPGDDLVRAGLYVRPPISTWIGSWRAQGFTGLTFKEANGRYHPGEATRDWATSGMPRR